MFILNDIFFRVKVPFNVQLTSSQLYSAYDMITFNAALMVVFF